jgi:anaerobic dimethyl sulfoxide reductase subunit B (iron-sulfur subunit)
MAMNADQGVRGDSGMQDYGLYIDLTRCTGCFACAVACMDENDLEVDQGSRGWRRVLRVEKGTYPEARIMFASLACMHCGDAPCILGCPTGALRREEGSPAVTVESPLCVGCHSCLLACPFGAPHFGRDGKMEKCDLCAERLAHGLEPACVRVCPAKALQVASFEELSARAAATSAERLVASLPSS